MRSKHYLVFIFSLLILLPLFSEEIVTLKDGSRVVLYDDNTWAPVEDSGLSNEQLISKNKPFLRQNIQASDADIIIACEMYEQGWRYTMPRPKSSKAAWGVSDGRTTWYYGWWKNSKTGQYSHSTPQKSSSGLYLGDNQNNSGSWRNGGSPSRPEVFMFLLSNSGGPRF